MSASAGSETDAEGTNFKGTRRDKPIQEDMRLTISAVNRSGSERSGKSVR